MAWLAARNAEEPAASASRLTGGKPHLRNKKGGKAPIALPPICFFQRPQSPYLAAGSAGATGASAGGVTGVSGALSAGAFSAGLSPGFLVSFFGSQPTLATPMLN